MKQILAFFFLFPIGAISQTNSTGWFYSFFPQSEVLTIPLKVRSQIDTFPQNVQTGLTNVGLGFNFINIKLVRNINSGISKHYFGLGGFIMPSAEELSPENTKYYVNKKSKQLFISVGLSFTYSYNDLSFVLSPLGYDFGTTTDGKNYIYNKKRWWGIGIGISKKLMGGFRNI